MRFLAFAPALAALALAAASCGPGGICEAEVAIPDCPNLNPPRFQYAARCEQLFPGSRPCAFYAGCGSPPPPTAHPLLSTKCGGLPVDARCCDEEP